MLHLNSLASLLPEQKSIYWEGDVRVPWFVLKQPSYFRALKEQELSFSVARPITYQHRYDTSASIWNVGFWTRNAMPPGADAGERAVRSRETFVRLPTRTKPWRTGA